MTAPDVDVERADTDHAAIIAHLIAEEHRNNRLRYVRAILAAVILIGFLIPLSVAAIALLRDRRYLLDQVKAQGSTAQCRQELGNASFDALATQVNNLALGLVSATEDPSLSAAVVSMIKETGPRLQAAVDARNADKLNGIRCSEIRPGDYPPKGQP